MSMEITLILCVLMGAATAYFAYIRGRDPYIWFAVGVLFGLLAMLLLVFLPPVKSEEELEADKKTQDIVGRRQEQVAEEERLENAQDLQPQSVETKEWFCLDKAGHQQGPLSFYLLNEMWENGDINSNSYIWTEGMAEWKHISDADDLHEVLKNLEDESRKTFLADL